VEQRGESAAETAARLSAQAAAQQQVAAEVHTKIIKTKHVLSEDYWSLREDELDDGVITMGSSVARAKQKATRVRFDTPCLVSPSCFLRAYA